MLCCTVPAVRARIEITQSKTQSMDQTTQLMLTEAAGSDTHVGRASGRSKLALAFCTDCKELCVC